MLQHFYLDFDPARGRLGFGRRAAQGCGGALDSEGALLGCLRRFRDERERRRE